MTDEVKPKKPTPSKMTDLQRRFCQEYIVDLNGTQAAIRAGYTQNPEAASVQSARLLGNARVVGFIQTLQDKRAKKLEVKSDEILQELTRLGYSDLRELYKEDGTIKHPKDWPTDLARAVSSIEVEETFEGHGDDRKWTGYTKKVKFWPKDKALELMGKHKKLFTDKIEVEGKMTLADLVAGSKEEKK